MMKISVALFISAVVGIGWAIGFLNIPGEWYAALNKPVFNPPNWIFGPVWTALYVLIGIAGWRTWRQGTHRRPFLLWLLQMGLNFSWSPVFFTFHALEPAFGIILALFLAIVAFIITCWGRDRASAWLFVPYAAWVAFAGVLNFSLIALN